MKKILLLFSLFFIASQSYAQGEISNETHSENLLSVAAKMADGMVAGDYSFLADFTYPKVVNMMGGKEEMVNMVSSELSKMEQDGYVIVDVRFKSPYSFVKTDDMLQCVLPQILTMNVPGGKLETESALIGLLIPGAPHWYLLDTSNQDLTALREMLPELSAELQLPAQKEPVFTKAK